MKKARLNNRKLTKGRKAYRSLIEGVRGYIPNHIRRNYKKLEKYMDELERMENLSPIEKMRKASKILHFQAMVRKYEKRIKVHNPEF